MNTEILVKGKGCISAKIIADSISFNSGKRITTFEIEYPRFIHSEFMTHRLFSRNCASSRAIPVNKIIEQVLSNPAKPIFWGKNQSGMQAQEEVENYNAFGQGEYQWLGASIDTTKRAKILINQGYHKQIVNRILEPFQVMKTVVTATEFDNFFYLRCHKDSQPEIQELSRCMYQCYEQNSPETLYNYEWHTPYVKHTRVDQYTLAYGENYELSTEQARIISASCCAQVSYRKLDDSYGKALTIFDKLINSKPCHASPVEHQATPIFEQRKGWMEGITHIDRKGNYWSGNFQGWIQFRQLIPNNACWNYKEALDKNNVE